MISCWSTPQFETPWSKPRNFCSSSNRPRVVIHVSSIIKLSATGSHVIGTGCRTAFMLRFLRDPPSQQATSVMYVSARRTSEPQSMAHWRDFVEKFVYECLFSCPCRWKAPRGIEWFSSVQCATTTTKFAFYKSLEQCFCHNWLVECCMKYVQPTADF